MQYLLSSTSSIKNIKFTIYRTIILAVILYGCKTWSFTLREESRVRFFEKRVLREIFGPKRDEVTGEWRKLRIEELSDLCSSPNIRFIKSRRMRWVEHVALTRDRRDVYRVLVGKPLGRFRRRLGDNIKKDLQELGLWTWTRLIWLRIGTDGGHL